MNFVSDSKLTLGSLLSDARVLQDYLVKQYRLAPDTVALMLHSPLNIQQVSVKEY